jgi:hypothetical protein
MTQYKVLEPIEIPKGMIIGLDWGQAATRLHSLKPFKKGKYEVKAPVTFKRGEVIGLEVKTKAIVAHLEPIGA